MSLFTLIGSLVLFAEGSIGFLLMDDGIREKSKSFSRATVVVIEQPLVLAAIAIGALNVEPRPLEHFQEERIPISV